MTKKNETPEQTLERLAQDARSGVAAAKRFETLVKRVAKTPSLAAKAKDSPETSEA